MGGLWGIVLYIKGHRPHMVNNWENKNIHIITLLKGEKYKKNDKIYNNDNILSVGGSMGYCFIYKGS